MVIGSIELRNIHFEELLSEHMKHPSIRNSELYPVKIIGSALGKLLTSSAQNAFLNGSFWTEDLGDSMLDKSENFSESVTCNVKIVNLLMRVISDFMYTT